MRLEFTPSTKTSADIKTSTSKKTIISIEMVNIMRIVQTFHVNIIPVPANFGNKLSWFYHNIQNN